MLFIILKSSTCLATLMVFYKLFLEKESIHHFKRFYLLGALLISAVIPFITFIEYVEATPLKDALEFKLIKTSNSNALNQEVIKTWQDYIPIILWSIF